MVEFLIYYLLKISVLPLYYSQSWIINLVTQTKGKNDSCSLLLTPYYMYWSYKCFYTHVFVCTVCLFVFGKKQQNMNFHLKYGFCKMYFDRNEPLTTWTLLTPFFPDQHSTGQRFIFIKVSFYKIHILIALDVLGVKVVQLWR